MGPAAGVEVELPADPSIGRSARRFTRQLLDAWEVPDELVDKAILVASELASNAYLHAVPPFLLTLGAGDGTIRVGVRDCLVLSPALRDYGDLALTGRGLRLVALSSLAWGVVGDPGGKEVWASVAGKSTGHDLVPMHVDGPPAEASGTSEGRRVVRFLGVPVDDYLALQAHNDGVFRECALLAAMAPGTESVPRVLDLARRLNDHFAGARDNYRDVVAAAQARGEQYTDLERRCDPAGAVEAVEASESFLTMMAELDELCCNQVLLSEPPTEAIVTIRRWFVAEMRSQLIDGVAPRPFRPPASRPTHPDRPG